MLAKKIGLKMKIQFIPIKEKDVAALIEPMKNAFDDDAKRFNSSETGGPPGYDDGSFLSDWAIKNKDSISYKIIVDDKSIGAFILWWNKDGESILGNVFIDPVFQGKGLGKKTWNFIEKNFPTKCWVLDTPTWAIRNHHFYEKVCGFIKTGIEDNQVIYKKKYQ
jgi:GNAT superfamily N-acetyltransferase